MSSNKLSHAIAVYRAMEDSSWVSCDVRGKIKLDAKIRENLDKLVELELALDTNHTAFPDGQFIEVEFSVPRWGNEFFAQDWSDLLESHDFLYETPDAFYIAKDDYFSEEQKKTHTSRRYYAVQSLIEVLTEVADYVDKSQQGMKLIFLNSTKLEIPIIYGADDLRDCPKIEELKSDITGPSIKHQEQRKSIIKVILNELLANKISEKRFTELLENFFEFTRRYKDSYELYISEFSFEKVFEEVNLHKLDYTIKLNKIFSDIQGQLLAIPAALILIGSKLTDKGYIEWQNSLTMLGCIIFIALMNMLIRNQYNSLNAIDVEIKQQFENLIRKHAAVIDRFNAPFNDLEKRHQHQKVLIRIVDGLVALMFLFCIVLFYWYSTMSNHWIKNFLINLF